MKNIIFKILPAECGVREYLVIVEGKRITRISNLSGDLMKILGLLGPPYEKYFF
jgi:hypothetical protein